MSAAERQMTRMVLPPVIHVAGTVPIAVVASAATLQRKFVSAQPPSVVPASDVPATA